MKLLFVQLSDVHCTTPPHIGDTKIEKIGHALRQLGSIDKIALIFTGDLMQSGEINQCKAGKIFISSVIRSIKKRNKQRIGRPIYCARKS